MAANGIFSVFVVRCPLLHRPRRPRITFLQSHGRAGEESSPDPGDSPTCSETLAPMTGVGICDGRGQVASPHP